MTSQLSKSIRQYMLVTFNYWNFTVTDGALRMLVVLYFHDLGYSTLAIASLFLFYEFFGVVTNLIGGWLGARLGLNKTMNIGLAMQVFALLMLAVPNAWLTIPWVMAAQALSGIAKDLNKMSAKSAIKTLVPDEQQGALYKWAQPSTCPWLDHLVSGLYPETERPVKTRFPYGSPRWLTLPLNISR